MKYIVRRYFSGYCTYEVEADSEGAAWELARGLPINYQGISSTLEEWEECNEIKPIEDN